MEILHFVVKNWYLFAGLAFVLGLLLADPIRRARYRIQSVNPAEAVLLINRQNAVVLDVRDAKAFQAGHVVGAVNIPLGEMKQRVSELYKYKSRPVVVNCHTGQAALNGAALLRRDGFENVHVMDGGMAAWERSQLPVEK